MRRKRGRTSTSCSDWPGSPSSIDRHPDVTPRGRSPCRWKANLQHTPCRGVIACFGGPWRKGGRSKELGWDRDLYYRKCSIVWGGVRSKGSLEWLGCKRGRAPPLSAEIWLRQSRLSELLHHRRFAPPSPLHRRSPRGSRLATRKPRLTIDHG